MAGGWYYAHDDQRNGPFSGEQLKEFAASGVILPTDTVWKGGVEEGVLASRIKNLFVPAHADEAGMLAPTEHARPDADMPAEEDVTPVHAPPEKYQPKAQEPTAAKKGMATAIKGADIAGQDGAYARYRMKCTVCGHKDASCRTIPIANKMIKVGFFCPKCKKRRDVVIQCRLG